MSKGFKCPKCSLIQLRGKRCVEDGTYLIECTLEEENSNDIDVKPITDNNNNANKIDETNSCTEEFFDTETFPENQFELHEKSTKLTNIRKVSNLKQDNKNASRPENEYQKCYLKVVVPKEYFINKSLEVCFLYDDCSKKAHIYYEVHTEKRDIFLFIFHVFMPIDLLDKQINYYYYLVDYKNDTYFEEKQLVDNCHVRTLDTSPNKYSQNHIDGLVLFKNDLINKLNLEYLKDKTVSTYFQEPSKIMWSENFIGNQRLFLALLQKIFDSICKTDSEYYNSFRKILNNSISGKVRKFYNMKEFSDNENLLALCIFYCCFNYNLELIKEDQRNLFLTLLKTMMTRDTNFFYDVFKNYFINNEQLSKMKECFKKFLEINSHNPIPEAIIVLIYYFFANDSLNYHNIQTNDMNLKNYKVNSTIREMLDYGSVSQKLEKPKLKYLIENLKPILLNQNVLSIIFVNYFCYSNIDNLKTMIEHDLLPIKFYLNYLEALNKYATNSNELKIKTPEKNMYLMILNNLIKTVSERVNQSNSDSHQNEMRLYDKDFKNFCAEWNLLKFFIDNRLNENDLILKLIHLSLTGYQLLAKTPELYERTNNKMELEYEYDFVFNLIENWLENQIQYNIAENYGFKSLSDRKDKYLNEAKEKANIEEPFIFDNLLSVEISSNSSINNKFLFDKKKFDDKILNILNKRILRSNFEEIIKIYSAFNFDNLKNKDKIRDEFKKVILVKLSNDQKLLIKLDELLRGQVLLEQLVDEYLTEYFPSNSDYSTISIKSNLYHLVSELYWKKRQNSTILNDKWKKEFGRIFDTFETMVNQLIDGDIEISKIKLLKDNYENFENFSKKIFQFYPDCKYKNHEKYFDRFELLINHRLKEWETVKEYHSVIVRFLQFCAKSNYFSYGSFKDVLDAYSSSENEYEQLNKFCAPINFKKITNDSETEVTYFPGIRKQQFEQMKQICKLDQLKCVILILYFKEQCKNKNFELQDVFEKILPSVLNQWKLFANEIDSGSIKLVKLDQLLKDHFQLKITKILDELFYIIEYFKIKNIERRRTQLDTYFKFRNSYETAIEIKKICEVFMINEFFEINEILKISSDEFQNWNLLKMDEKMENLIRTLETYSSVENINCLQAFRESSELVLWVKSNIVNLPELNFFVDQVSMSKSSELQNTTGKDVFAKTLKEACSAYSPLIFELKENISFKDFMSLCNKVWINLQNDSNIAEKLRAMKDQVNVLEEIRFIRGNVELSSIEQTKQLNKNGVYTISLLDKNRLKQIEIKDIIELNILMETGKINDKKERIIERKQEKFSYEKLLDLKSILMLVSKKTNETESAEHKEAEALEYFIEIFDNIVRLADSLIKLIHNGCDLFDNFKIEIYADHENKRLEENQSVVDLSFGSNQILSENRESSKKILQDLCERMEFIYETWCNYVQDVRDRFYSVNYFTIKQIIFIKSTFNNVLRTSTIDKKSFDLIKSILNNIRSDFQIDSFANLLNNSFNKIKNENYQYFSKKFKNKELSEKNETINRIAIENNFSKHKVKEAYDKFGNSEQDIIDYCFVELDDNYDPDEEMDVDQEFLVEQKNFASKIECIFDQFMINQNLLNSTNLNLQRFAALLDELRDSNIMRFDREIPGYLVHRGKPNLIMCENQRDQIPVVLSIYGLTFKAPLPSNDEVLFCNSDTTSEEICNFFRIAFKSNGSKIYSLINIQELTYENSSNVEKFLSSNTNLKQSDNYVLVCISSTEKAEQSLITSSIIKNRVKPILLKNEDIECYLSDKLRFNSQGYQVQALISQRAGNGKSTYVEWFKRTNQGKNYDYQIIRIKTHKLDFDFVLNKLFNNRTNSKTLYHIDIAFEVFLNVDLFLFNLAILNHLKHSDGRVWRRSNEDLYFIEIMPPFINNTTYSLHSTINFLPKINFRNPNQYYYELFNKGKSNLPDNLFTHHFSLKSFQRCAMYLKIYVESIEQLMNYSFNPLTDRLDEATCLKYLIDYSGLRNPNWADIHKFVNFLDNQLEVLESATVIRTIPFLKNVCTRFIIMMAIDFGLPSLNLQDDSEVFNLSSDNRIEIKLDRYEIARNWENMSHPYIIFNSDRETFTFMGIYMDRRDYSFINPNTGTKLQDVQVTLDGNARIALLQQRVPIYDNFNGFPRTKKINCLRSVMGLDFGDFLNYDPDPTYELTLDNCLKLMAIFMRLRCNNPVVIMGETGCGKTRKLKFYSDLHISSRKKNQQVKHLIHFKVHGGTTYEDIEQKLREAERLSRLNFQSLFDNQTFNQNGIPATAILFIDEANTTDAIGLIKEIMCDLTCNGRKIDFAHGLKIVAAVNPYRRHSEGMIKKLEEAGLGFYISANDSKEKIGHIPMRQLVYRVQPLPASMLPLVWDFGQLNSDAEKVYIKEMIKKACKLEKLPTIDNEELKELIDLLVESQNFMRSSNDECSFVSLRDIERVIKVTSWFIEKQDLLFPKMLEKKIELIENDNYQNFVSNIKRAFILALAVCYHSSLYNMNKRFEYRKMISRNISINFDEINNYSQQFDWVLYEILKCQYVFLDEIELPNYIARNQALLENVFMIIVSIELRIPLFIVGKPGSSKSLAKSIVESSMHGQNSRSELFKNLKQTYFLNFQCSPLTRSDMIINTFQEAASFQENNDLNKCVSVVNLDEVGLAEASESMPLKVLHPLLEDGSDSSEDNVLPHQKVAVIGISNWALDPAKMNRGIFVSRSEPDIDELVESAKGICKYDLNIYNSIKPFIREIAEAYLTVCKIAKDHQREFFGLRDYYSLIKMIYWFCTKDGCLTWNKLEHSVRRNFSGLDLDMVEPFKKLLYSKLDTRDLPTDPKCRPIDLIKAALKGENVESNSRYLLLLSENYTVIDIIQSYLINNLNIPPHKVVVIFGSSFKNDLENTEICKNISKIKHSMEVGNTVILLNFQNLFESLYDVLNQYYKYFGGQRFVYLGINTQRVNCVVHENFRMIILADKVSVYDSKRFPIPLVNRLEKHFLNASTMLNKSQLNLCNHLEDWLKKFVSNEHGCRINDMFVGYHDDALATLILYLVQDGRTDYFSEKDDNELMETDTNEHIISNAKSMLLDCSTLDNIYRAINKNLIDPDYLTKNQQHFNLVELLRIKLNQKDSNELNKNLLQVTTYSKYSLSKKNLVAISEKVGIKDSNISACFLKSFDTQNQFSNRIKKFLSTNSNETKCLIIQCDFRKKLETDLLSSTKHSIVEIFKQYQDNNLKNCYIILLINMPREFSRNFIGFQVSQWSCHHIEELDDTIEYFPKNIDYFKSKRLSQILKESLYDKEGIKLKDFLRIVSNQSCSMIQDTNITRTIQRVSIFNRLCNNEKFLEAILNRLIELQIEKENNYGATSVVNNWFLKDANSFRRINEYSTLKKSCRNYLESKISPLLAFLLSKLDSYCNMDILDQNDIDWKSILFVEILNNSELFRLKYSDMRNDVENEELKEFYCKSEQFEKKISMNDPQKLPANYPFFWIIVEQLNEFCLNYLDSVSNMVDENQKKKYYLSTIPELFEKTTFYKLLRKTIESNDLISKTDIFDLYLNDFIIVNCQVRLSEEVKVIKKAMKSLLFKKFQINDSDFKISFPLIHLIYQSFKSKIDLYLKFSLFNPDINKNMQTKSNFEEIHFDACLEAIDQFIRGKSENLEKNSKKLEDLLKIIRNVLPLSKNEAYQKLIEKYNSLKIFHLFLETTCNKDRDVLNDIYSDLITQLRVDLLKNSLLIKSNKYVNFVHEFLVKCVERGRKKFFLQSIESKCCNQKSLVYYKLNTNDCSCIVCENCNFKMSTDIRKNSTVLKKLCQACKKQINLNVNDDRISVKLSDISERKGPYDKLISNLNLFYFNLIDSFICKSNNSILELETIKSIYEVIKNGKISSDHNSLILEEKNRDLVLQILFRNTENVTEFLENWFRETEANNDSEMLKSRFKMASNILKCVEDSCYNDLIELTIDDEIILANNICENLINNHDVLNQILINRTTFFDTQSLFYLAKLKFCLKILAKLTNSQENMDSINNKPLFDLFNTNMQNLIKPTLNITDTIFNFLIKEFIRKYSYGSIKYVMNNTSINWMMPKKLIGEKLKIRDCYVLIGQKYIELKNAIKEGFHNRNSDQLELILKNEEIQKIFPYLAVCLYKNLTLLQKEVDVVPVEIFSSTLAKYCSLNRKYWQPIIHNDLKHNLKVDKENSNSIEFCLLILQLKFSILFSRSPFIKPFRDLIEMPKNFGMAFIPCMPQDTLFDNYNALRAVRTSDNPTLYACPNGHPYILFDCGRPWVITKCKDCNADIGGTGHNLLPGNTRIDPHDRTKTGYCLSPASSKTGVPANERKLNLSSFHLLRFIVHCAFYFACENSEDDVLNIMEHKPLNVKQFFWDQMQNDFRIVSSSLNLNTDELMILLHLISDDILKKLASISNAFTWNSKSDRENFEKDFFEYYLQDKIKNSSRLIKDATEKLKTQDEQNDDTSQRLFFMAYELLNQNTDKVGYLYETQDFWKYQPTCNFNVFKIEIGFTNQEDNHLLKQIVEKENELKLIKNLKDIMKMVNYFHTNHFRQIHKHTVSKMDLKDALSNNFFSKSFTKETLNSSIKAYQEVWFNTKHQLLQNANSLIFVDEKFKFDMDTKLSYFIPSKSGDGFISYAMINYLIRSQNEILESYCKNKELLSVDVRLVEDAEYLINFDTNSDFLIILKSNFIFDSKENRHWFQFENINDQVINRYLKNKPLIELDIPVFNYSDELNDFNLFKKLDSIIEQKLIDVTLMLNIFNDFDTIDQTADALNVMKILINYAKITSANPDETISNFSKNIYVDRNVESVLKLNIMEQCQLKNLQSLWILLTMKRAFMYTINNMNPFENLSDRFKISKQVDINIAFDPQNTLTLSLIIFQLINYCSNITSDEDYTAHKKIRDVFFSLDNLNIRFSEDPNRLANFLSSEDKMENIYSVWLKLTTYIKRFN